MTHGHMGLAPKTADGCEIQMHAMKPEGNSLLLVFTGESNHSRASERWCEMDFVHPQQGTAAFLDGFQGNPSENYAPREVPNFEKHPYAFMSLKKG